MIYLYSLYHFDFLFISYFLFYLSAISYRLKGQDRASINGTATTMAPQQQNQGQKQQAQLCK